MSSFPERMGQAFDSVALTRTLGLLAGLLVAVIFGFWIGGGQWRFLTWALGLIVLTVVVVGLQRQAWLLVLVCWSFTGRTGVLGVPFSLQDLSILLAVAAYVGYRVLAPPPPRRPLHFLELLVALNLAWVVVTYMLNPVGVLFFRTERIGGRPYITMALAAAAFWVIHRMPKTTSMVARVPLLLSIGALGFSLLHLTAHVLPSLPARLPFLYSVFDAGTLEAGRQVWTGIRRINELAVGGSALVLCLAAYYPPRTLFNPLRLRFYLLGLGAAGIMASGLRSGIVTASVSILLAAALYRQWRELIAVIALGGTMLTIVLFGQGRLFELPLAAQRSLSFLPSSWAPEAIAEGESSNRRWLWWAEIIEKGSIKNWWTGDGFGTSMDEITDSVVKSGAVLFELTGGYHNGPLSTIRYAGIIGLVLFYALMISAACAAVRCVRQARDTPVMPAAIFLAVNLIWAPISFTLIFGGYEGQLPQHLLWIVLLLAVLRQIEPAPAAVPETVPRRRLAPRILRPQ